MTQVNSTFITMLNPTQRDLFAGAEENSLPRPEIRYLANQIPDHETYFTYLRDRVDWNCRFKSRRTVTFGESYNYRSETTINRELPAFINPFCDVVFQQFDFRPNNCLVNYYPDGEHYISFHSDQDTEMKDHTGVAIFSLGTMREMVLRYISAPTLRYVYPLEPGSVFYMSDELQSEWQHGIPKQSGRGPRISLSFRSLRVSKENDLNG
ncbi:MAG: alpha-ketoglutarate-dependent dioxygenase AlkB [Arenicellales bacterium]